MVVVVEVAVEVDEGVEVEKTSVGVEIVVVEVAGGRGMIFGITKSSYAPLCIP